MRPFNSVILLIALILAAGLASSSAAQDLPRLYVPFLSDAPNIDGDLEEWKRAAHHDGVWDIYRLRDAPWYDGGARNRLTDQVADEPPPEDDLNARYYMAWDDEYLYFGAEVVDNVNDVDDPNHAPRRWMFKDAVCWFIEAPKDDAPEWFGRGDNGFCFVADESMPDYGAWWRYGTPTETYQEAVMPDEAVDYALEFNPWGTGEGDFILEARIRMDAFFPISDPRWVPPAAGDEYSLMIVHTDPDGGAYGGHFMVYGDGDDDSTWSRVILVGEQRPIERLPE
jgi:hypothetical protein